MLNVCFARLELENTTKIRNYLIKYTNGNFNACYVSFSLVLNFLNFLNYFALFNLIILYLINNTFEMKKELKHFFFFKNRSYGQAVRAIHFFP